MPNIAISEPLYLLLYLALMERILRVSKIGQVSKLREDDPVPMHTQNAGAVSARNLVFMLNK